MEWQRNYVLLKTDERVRFTLHKRDGSKVYLVRFKATDGRRLEKSTGVAKKPDAYDEAKRIILDEYEQLVAAGETVTWVLATEKLKAKLIAQHNRPITIRGYVETLGHLRVMFPTCGGPSDITERHAEEFKVKYGQGLYTRKRKLKKDEVAPLYGRKAKSLDTRIRTLKAVFEHMLSMHPPIVKDNPFSNVSAPKLDKEVKLIQKTDVSDVFDWLNKRYPEWSMPLLFFRVKALTGCRLDDLCSLPSSAVADGGITFPGNTAKHRKGHYAKLPDDVFKELKLYKGMRWVWEKYPPELKTANEKLGVPYHRLNMEFSTRRLYLWVIQLMQIYQKQTGKDFSSHDFRKAAFTRAAEKDVHIKKAATGFDVTPETMLRYYTAIDQRKAAEELTEALANDLDPTRVNKKAPKP